MRYIVKSKHQDIRKVATYMERETWLDKAVSNYHAGRTVHELLEKRQPLFQLHRTLPAADG